MLICYLMAYCTPISISNRLEIFQVKCSKRKEERTDWTHDLKSIKWKVQNITALWLDQSSIESYNISKDAFLIEFCSIPSFIFVFPQMYVKMYNEKIYIAEVFKVTGKKHVNDYFIWFFKFDYLILIWLLYDYFIWFE